MSKTYLSLGTRISFTSLSLCESAVINLIFSIIPFMTEFYLKDAYPNTVPEEIISSYSGYLEGIFRLMQFFSSLWMSILSDKIGRKIVTMGALFISLLSSLALGLCTTYESAIYIRIISGFFAGNSPINKSMIREVTDDTNISTLYGSFTLGIGIANFLGPLMASLSKPADTIGWIFNNDFFRTYPYFLPLSLHSFMCFLTLILVWYYLPSIKPKVEKSQGFRSLFSNKLYISSVSIYAILAFMQYGFRLVFSLISKSAENLGGMGISSESEVSVIQGFAGIFTMILPPLLTPMINMKFGLIRSMIGISIVLVPIYLSVFICRELDGLLKYAALSIFYGINNSCGSISISYASIIISNTVTSDILGAANGLSQAIIGVFRFISSSFYGVIYGWSVTSGLAFPLIDASFSYLILISLSITLLVIIMKTLDSSVEHKKGRSSVEIPLLDSKKK
ncbi:hypothetical protein SteCoe_19879 [Stentor coeruleus]|uniref:Major facilitator superfamily (MFS) profile domain-containing protein n=1 Tax=Stentor coeruleus TaxID=5963 RepID=A0A1R2BT89_9CILI|nr:hypothetical protein SteCoe_19879 [Stentor coeruleus]